MGGAVCNVIADIAALDGEVPLTALGRIGNDEDGNLLLSFSCDDMIIRSIHMCISPSTFQRVTLPPVLILMPKKWSTNQIEEIHVRFPLVSEK
jgi:hypothetical protein